MQLIDKLQNFERIPSNLLRRLIQGSFVGTCVVGTHLDDVEAWLFWRCMTKSQKIDFLVGHVKKLQEFLP
jgi:hypothetical protein